MDRCSYDDFSFYPKNEFPLNPSIDNSLRSFSLNSGEIKYIDIAYRKDHPTNQYDYDGTYLRIAAPNYVNKHIGDFEILGLKLILTASGTVPSELRLDIFYEKGQSTNQDGKVSYYKILKCRESILEPDKPTEIRRYEEKITDSGIQT